MAWHGRSAHRIGVIRGNISLHHGVRRKSSTAFGNGTVEMYYRQATSPAILEISGGSDRSYKSGS